MPIFSRKKVFLYGFLIWTIWVFYYAVAFKLQTRQPWGVALFSSAVNNYIYALLSIGIWKACKKIPFNKFSIVLILLIHFILANIFSFIWLSLNTGILYLQGGREIFAYIDFKNIVGWQFLFGVIEYMLIAGIFYTIIYYGQFRDKELKESDLKILSREAELKALKMQMNPHFLFNSLNSINALIKNSPDHARKMMSLLSDLLRFSLETKEKSKIPFKQELELMHQYLAIEKIRFMDRMEITEEIEPGLDTYLVPAMLLQPLLENSVKHGVASHRGKGWINIKIWKNEKLLYVSLSNSVNKDKIEKFNNKKQISTGLKNIRQRLDLLYGENYNFSFSRTNPNVFKVNLSIPLE